jgi:hypothetical protein
MVNEIVAPGVHLPFDCTQSSSGAAWKAGTGSFSAAGPFIGAAIGLSAGPVAAANELVAAVAVLDGDEVDFGNPGSRTPSGETLAMPFSQIETQT